MNFAAIGESVAAAVVGGFVTGSVAWMKFNTALAILRRDVDQFKEACEVCRGGLRMEDARISGAVTTLQEAVQRHHEMGPHYLPADRKLSDDRWEEIRDRLRSIEEYLRNGKKPAVNGG